MASEKIFCPECKVTLKFPEHTVGVMKCQCPKCGAQVEVMIPAPATPASVTQSHGVTARKTDIQPLVQQSSESPASSASDVPPTQNAGSRWLVIGCLSSVLLSCILCAGVGIFIGADKLNPDTPNPQVASGKTTKSNPGKKEPGPLPNNQQPDANKKEKVTIPFEAVASRSRLKEIMAVQIKGKVKSAELGNETDVTITWGSLKRLKFEQATGSPTCLVLFKDHGWELRENKAAALQGKTLTDNQNAYYAMILSNLIPLLEPDFDFEMGEERSFKGKSCECAVVKRNGKPTASLFFEKMTDQLLKVEIDGEFIGAPANTRVAFHYSDHQKTDGVTHWRKQEQYRDGKLYDHLTVSEIRFFDKLDDALFTAPGLEEQIRTVLGYSQLDEKRELVQQVLRRLPGKEPDFTRLVKSSSHKEADVRTQGRQGILAYADLWWKNQVPPFERSDMDSLLLLLKTSEDKELQSFAVEALTHLGSKAAETVPGLLKIGRESQNSKVLAGALSVLKSMRIQTNEAMAVFEKHLDHADPGVKELAALALLAVGPNRLPINCVINLLARPEADIRAAARKLMDQKMSALTRKDLPMLRQNLKKPVPEIRFAVMEAIGSLKENGKEAAPDLIPLIGSAEKDIPAQAIATLEKIGKLMDVACENSDPAILTPTLAALRAKNIKTTELLAACEKHLDHPDVGVKDAAALLLLDLEPMRLRVDRLAECAASANEQVRTAGDKLLRKKLASVTVKDLPSLRQGLKNPSRDLRILFVEAIASLKADGKEAAPELADVLGTADNDLAIPIIRALESMGKGGVKAVSALEKKVESPEKSVAIAATQALCRLDPANGVLKAQGIALLLEDLNPDITKLDVLLAKPLHKPSASALVDLGEPAVVPLVKNLFNRYSPKNFPANQQMEATAYRYVGYELIKELAKRAKANDDKQLSAALKKYEITLKVSWERQEKDLAKQAQQQPKLAADVRQLYAATAEAAYQSYKAVFALR